MRLTKCSPSESSFGFVTFCIKIPKFACFQGLRDTPRKYQMVNINPLQNVFLTSGDETKRDFQLIEGLGLLRVCVYFFFFVITF